jgi:hypothetical protein
MNLGRRPSLQAGNALMITLAVAACVGIVLAACLSLVNSQNMSVSRSQAWNACMPVIEAGVEEAMAHLNNTKETSYNVNGWTQNGVLYSRSRVIGDGFYDVTIALSNTLQPTIVCTGYYRAPALVSQAQGPMMAAAGVNVGGIDYISRAVQVLASKQGIFNKAMVAKQRIVMNGNNIDTDSFDSTDPNYSTAAGLYDPAKARDNGDVATLSGIADAIGSGNANIKGRVRTAPGGTVDVGANGVVGSLQWHAAGNTGIQPGWWFDDMNMTFPDVEMPSLSGSFPPSSGTVTGAVYKYVLDGGKFALSTLNISSKERIAVTAPSTLIVNGDVDVKGAIDIMKGGSLELYVVGSNASLGGLGINQTGFASNFVYYGLPSNTKLTLPSNGDFTGVLYAPSATLTLSGGGSTTVNFSGACIMNRIVVSGHYKFHFDEALIKHGPWRDYVIYSWVEL